MPIVALKMAPQVVTAGGSGFKDFSMSLGALKPATERRFKTSQLGSCLVM
jgi:hypothetical protein